MYAGQILELAEKLKKLVEKREEAQASNIAIETLWQNFDGILNNPDVKKILAQAHKTNCDLMEGWNKEISDIENMFEDKQVKYDE